MKDATGEMSMTVIVILAAAFILTIGYTLWPYIQNKITEEVDNIGANTPYIIDVDESYNA